MDELLKLHYTDLSERDLQEFKKIDYESEIPKIKPSFHLKAFLFGAFYLLYRKLYLEGVAVIIFSLLLFRVSPIVGIVAFFVSSGTFYYFLYTNKFKKDVEKAGYPLTDKEQLKDMGGTSPKAVIGTIIITIALFWPMVASYIDYISTHK
jgi:hypothetical protein